MKGHAKQAPPDIFDKHIFKKQYVVNVITRSAAATSTSDAEIFAVVVVVVYL